MKRLLVILIVPFCIFNAKTQELFLFTNPASNIPKNTLVARGMNSFFQRTLDNSVSYHFMPEVEFGLTKRLMVITNGFISNGENNLTVEGGSLLTQYRFFSKDASKEHFRMALWSRFALNNADIHQEEIEMNGHNSGFRIGFTATQLLHKTAISSTLSYQKALNNFTNKLPVNYSTQAVDFTLSFGQLVLPKTYKNFNQTNVNIMVEMLGQRHLSNGNSFLDIAPVIQFIFKSKARLDIAYRRQLYSSIYRTQPNGIVINFQYAFFNLAKKK
jgi:hypothetical protein